MSEKMMSIQPFKEQVYNRIKEIQNGEEYKTVTYPLLLRELGIPPKSLNVALTQLIEDKRIDTNWMAVSYSFNPKTSPIRRLSVRTFRIRSV